MSAKPTARTNISLAQYMSIIVAGLFMIHLAPIGIFSFATTAAISTATIVKLCVFQIVPELFMDFYGTFMDIYLGLKKMHVSYWKTDMGVDKGGEQGKGA